MTNKEVVLQFGNSLDNDEYDIVRSLLDDNCVYFIGKDQLHGPIDIAKSYEDNMIEGRKKLDNLEWGRCTVEAINVSDYYIHFTDYLTHQSKSFTHRCKQKVTIGKQQKIVAIEHIEDPEAQNRLNKFYKSVGLL